jgi:hypothetical protein
MDARFQDDFVASAKRARKLPQDYRIAETARTNLPDVLEGRLGVWRKQGLFTELPFGSDFTAEEVVLAKALKRLAALAATWQGRIQLASRAVSERPDKNMHPYLERMSLSKPTSLQEHVEQRMLLVALREVKRTK